MQILETFRKSGSSPTQCQSVWCWRNKLICFLTELLATVFSFFADGNGLTKGISKASRQAFVGAISTSFRESYRALSHNPKHSKLQCGGWTSGMQPVTSNTL